MYSRMNPARVDREDEKRMLPCRYFLSGFCHKGNRCKFYHPNIHTRDPVIRPPEMPVDFTMSHHQYNQFARPHRVPSLLDMTGSGRASSSRSRVFNGSVHNSPIRHRDSTPSPPRASISNGSKNFMSPLSQSYSEYLACTQRQRDNPGQKQVDEDEMKAAAEESKTNQNTVFSHIDWSEFLAPGVFPPPPTQISNQSAAPSPDQASESGFPRSWRPAISNSEAAKLQMEYLKINSQDVPPEGSQVRVNILGDNSSSGLLPSLLSIPTKLSAKEELQLKVKQIAQELADEPVQHVRSLDSFFRNFKFNGFACTSPSSPSTSVDTFMNENEGLDVEESNKENSIEIEIEAEQPNQLVKEIEKEKDVESDVISLVADVDGLCVPDIPEPGYDASPIENDLSVI